MAVCIFVIEFCCKESISPSNRLKEMATGANAIPLGKIHPILAGRLNDPPPQQEISTNKVMSRSEELKQHLEAAKRAASALFPSKSAHFVTRSVHFSVLLK